MTQMHTNRHRAINSTCFCDLYSSEGTLFASSTLFGSMHILGPCTPHHSPSHHARCGSYVAMPFSKTVHDIYIKVPATLIGDPTVR